MKKIATLFSLLMLSVFVSEAQQVLVKVNFLTDDPDDTLQIFYRPGNKLSWKDFQGIPQEIENVAAVTSSGIGYSYKYSRTDDTAILTFEVYCLFRKEKSWVLNNDRKNAYTLNHEQRHFDISYLNTLWFIQTLRNTKFSGKDYKKIIGIKYKEASFALTKMQNEYDTQAKNGIDKSMQAEWNTKVDDLISKISKEVLNQ
jgi:hypothetical protein